MRMVVISDVHNNLVRLQRVLEFCQEEKVEGIISCGDLASEETLQFLSDHFSGLIWHVLGNMDQDFLRKKIVDVVKEKNVTIFSDFGEIQLGEKKFAFVHFPQKAKKLLATGRYAVVFYGHTHCPWLKKTKGRYLVNPGNVAGEGFEATFALWETEYNHFRLLSVDKWREERKKFSLFDL